MPRTRKVRVVKTTTTKKKPNLEKKVLALEKRFNQVNPRRAKIEINLLGYTGPFNPDVGGIVGYSTIGSLCNPAQGVAYNQRVGDRVRATSLKWYFTMALPAANNTAFNEIRMIVIYDKENVFANGAQLLTQTVNVCEAELQPSERPRYTLLLDRVFAWQQNATVAAGVVPSLVRKGRINLKNKLVTFQPGNSNVYHGNFKAFFLCNAALGTGATVCTFTSECWFLDSN